MLYGYRYVSFTWDEMDKKPEACRRTVYEMLGRFGGPAEHDAELYSVHERELLRYAQRLGRPIKLGDACDCLRLSNVTSARILKSLVDKQALRPLRVEKQRVHAYELLNHTVMLR